MNLDRDCGTADRAELFLTVVVGYMKSGRDNIEKDPECRVQGAIALAGVRQAHGTSDDQEGPGSGSGRYGYQS
jgi:hypothetical protein